MSTWRTDRRPRLLDLFCGQCGAGWGYHLAGFQVTGVDIRPIRKRPHSLAVVHYDAIAYLRAFGHQFDAIHASPVCRAHTRAGGGARYKYQHADHIPALRRAFAELDAEGYCIPRVIENVPGAPLIDPVVLCGAMFGLETYRHRLFEFGNMPRPTAPPHPEHIHPAAPMGRRPREGEYWSLAGNFSGVKEAGRMMRMPWANQDGLRQAIPPAYARWVGHHLMRQVMA